MRSLCRAAADDLTIAASRRVLRGASNSVWGSESYGGREKVPGDPAKFLIGPDRAKSTS